MNGARPKLPVLDAPRTDFKTPNGRVIRARNVSTGAGIYEADGKRFVCVHLLDPAVAGGERLIYVLTKAEALTMADGLRRAAEAAT